MSRPPNKALESIKNYCEKTQCRRCVFGRTRDDDYHYVECTLLGGCSLRLGDRKEE